MDDLPKKPPLKMKDVVNAKFTPNQLEYEVEVRVAGRLLERRPGSEYLFFVEKE